MRNDRKYRSIHLIISLLTTLLFFVTPTRAQGDPKKPAPAAPPAATTNPNLGERESASPVMLDHFEIPVGTLARTVAAVQWIFREKGDPATLQRWIEKLWDLCLRAFVSRLAPILASTTPGESSLEKQALLSKMTPL